MNPANLSKTETPTYESPDHYTSEVIGICNSVSEDKVVNSKLITLLLNNLDIDKRKSLYDGYSLISPGKQIEILENYESSNQIIAKDYLNRENGVLFFEKYPDTRRPWEPFEPINLKQFIPLVMEILTNQEKRLLRLEKIQKNLEK